MGACCDHQQHVIIGRETQPWHQPRGIGWICCLSHDGCGEQRVMPQTWQVTHVVELA